MGVSKGIQEAPRREETEMTNEQSIETIAKVDQMVCDRIGNRYEVFAKDGDIYISAPMDESEAESTECPTCVYVMPLAECADEDELYQNAPHASDKVDAIISHLEREGLR